MQLRWSLGAFVSYSTGSRSLLQLTQRLPVQLLLRRTLRGRFDRSFRGHPGADLCAEESVLLTEQHATGIDSETESFGRREPATASPSEQPGRATSGRGKQIGWWARFREEAAAREDGKQADLCCMERKIRVVIV